MPCSSHHRALSSMFLLLQMLLLHPWPSSSPHQLSALGMLRLSRFPSRVALELCAAPDPTRSNMAYARRVFLLSCKLTPV